MIVILIDRLVLGGKTFFFMAHANDVTYSGVTAIVPAAGPRYSLTCTTWSSQWDKESDISQGLDSLEAVVERAYVIRDKWERKLGGGGDF